MAAGQRFAVLAIHGLGLDHGKVNSRRQTLRSRTATCGERASPLATNSARHSPLKRFTPS
ncbi:hypothetical protein UCMB321_1794 [Pseudomonas batumici]|uniref:Uncharacterized protein n=1 Tax=Pseudomonas batumici TaxID=226910 RepID=A0A0C2F0G7_9PSED|nr:hypothetical protein UCMB321_1794 [Pseudomonas batumici]